MNTSHSRAQSSTSTAPATWSQLLEDAVRVPGRLHEAYAAFHNYSLGNQLLALFQCANRGIEPGPIATYSGWQTKGRQVRKGEKALTLCQPRTWKKQGDADEDAEADGVHLAFMYRAGWFVYTQTDGDPLEFPAAPGWNRTRALEQLGIREIPFTLTDGNVQGYANPDRGEIAINPVAALPLKTTFHELGHCLLHRGDCATDDGETFPKNLREVEAEAVALILSEVLELVGAEFSRGYIQSYLRTEEIPEMNARRIFAGADRILRAGQPYPV